MSGHLTALEWWLLRGSLVRRSSFRRCQQLSRHLKNGERVAPFQVAREQKADCQTACSQLENFAANRAQLALPYLG
jgi:hypothetical protein